MDDKKFVEVFKDFKNRNEIYVKKTTEDAKKTLDIWGEYREKILSEDGFPLSNWLEQSEEGNLDTLPNFLDNKGRQFGRARIGNYDQIMIYHCKSSSKEPEKVNKYVNMYSEKGKQFFDKEEDIVEDYKNKIQVLLKNLVTAVDDDYLNPNSADSNVYKLVDNELYKQFRNKQILNKIVILESIWNLYNAEKNGKEAETKDDRFMWFYGWGFFKNVHEAIKNYNNSESISDDDQDNYFKYSEKLYKEVKNLINFDTSSFDLKERILLYWFINDILGGSLDNDDYCEFKNLNIIYNGAPGTGKTYNVLSKVKQLNVLDKGRFKDFVYIQFHPNYSYQDFIEGFKPIGLNNGNVDLQLVNGNFKDFCIKVKKENEEYYDKSANNKDEIARSLKSEEIDLTLFDKWPHYYFIVDEINRGNLSNIFGETFTLLEASYRDYDFTGKYEEAKKGLVKTNLSNVIAKLDDDKKEGLIYKKINGECYFGIPFNIHFIGMMNDVDRSIDSFDLAFRRRFKWIQTSCDLEVVKNQLFNEEVDEKLIIKYEEACKRLNDYICEPGNDGLGLSRTYEIGHSYFSKIRNYLNKKKTFENDALHSLFDSYLSGIIKEYCRQSFDEKEIEDILKKCRDELFILKDGKK